MSRLIDIETERRCLCISFPYDSSLVDLVRTFPERFYDRDRRVWFVPLQHLPYVLSHLGEHHFKLSASLRRYCDEQDEAPLATGHTRELPRTKALPQGSYTVSKLNQAARQALRMAFSDEIWLVAELQDFDKNGATNYRTYFFDLVERPLPGAAETARIKAVLFDEARLLIEQRLEQSGAGIRLRDGLSVHVKGRVELYAQHGRYQIIITDIDPSYTTGEIELNRERILRELEKLDIAQHNARRPWPTCPLRVGLITSYESDAYNDFIHQLTSSGLGFDVALHHAQVQGQHTEASVLRALAYFAERSDDFDVVAIVRGGGSRSDLAYFDTLPIGRAVCEHPLKVLCGVGHQRDQCLLDAIAHSTKTPTAAAEFLIHAVEDYWNRAEETFDTLVTSSFNQIQGAQNRHYRLSTGLERNVTRRLADARRRYETLRTRITHQALDVVRLGRSKLEKAGRSLEHQAHLRLERENLAIHHGMRSLSPARIERILRRPADELERYARRLERTARRPIARSTEQLDHLEQKARLLDPQRVLERGFALVRDAQGKLVKSPDDVVPTQPLDIRLATGSLRVNVRDEDPEDFKDPQ